MKIFYSNFFRRFFPGRILPLLEKTKTEKEEEGGKRKCKKHEARKHDSGKILELKFECQRLDTLSTPVVRRHRGITTETRNLNEKSYLRQFYRPVCLQNCVRAERSFVDW